MKFCVAIVLLACALTGRAQDHGNLFRVRTASDARGATHQLGRKPGVRAIVLVFLGPECPISQRYTPELNRIAAAYRTNAMEFYGVVSARGLKRESVAAFVKDYAIEFTVLVDSDLALARWQRPTHVPEAFVLKADGDRVYHGRIDDWYQALGKPRRVVQQRDLREAIDAVLAGQTPARAFAPPVGCYFEELR